jgi:hypothetical protein
LQLPAVRLQYGAPLLEQGWVAADPKSPLQATHALERQTGVTPVQVDELAAVHWTHSFDVVLQRPLAQRTLMPLTGQPPGTAEPFGKAGMQVAEGGDPLQAPLVPQSALVVQPEEQ